MADVTAPQFQQDANNAADWANGDENTTVTMRLGQQARSPAKVIKDIQNQADDALVEINKSRGFRRVGTFASGFTYELANDVGIDADGDAWVYTNIDALPVVVAAGTVPSEPEYTPVVFSDHASLTNRNDPNAHESTSLNYTQSVNQRSVDEKLSDLHSIDDYIDQSSFDGDINSKNPDYQTEQKHYSLPFNSVLHLGQVRLWQGAGGLWGTGSNNNLSLGQDSLISNTIGQSNTAFGYETLKNNTSGVNNTAVGRSALINVTTGTENTAVGVNALRSVTTSEESTAVGRSCLDEATGGDNTGVGYKCFQLMALGSGNTGLGNNVGSLLTDASNSVAIGYRALLGENTESTGAISDRNVAVGYEAMRRNKDSQVNVAVGTQSLLFNETGDQNVAIGFTAMRDSITQSNNVAVGHQAMQQIDGGLNTAVGANAMITGNGSAFRNNCTAVGANTLVTGSNQVQLGDPSTTTYAYGAVQDRSDARDKIIEGGISDDLIAFFMDVEWKTYRLDYRENYKSYRKKLNDDGTPAIDENGNEIIELVSIKKDGSKAGKRHHLGAIAQQVEQAMVRHNVDFAGLQHHAKNGGEDVYSIGYQEFIAIQGEIIQRQQKSILDILKRLDDANL